MFTVTIQYKNSHTKTINDFKTKKEVKIYVDCCRKDENIVKISIQDTQTPITEAILYYFN